MFFSRFAVGLCAFLLLAPCHGQIIGYPAPPSNSSSPGDEVRSRDGIFCKGSNSGPVLDLGSSMVPRYNNYFPIVDPAVRPADDMAFTGYVRVVIPLGDRPDPVDCNRLFELEIQRLQLELQNLQQNKGSKIIVK